MKVYTIIETANNRVVAFSNIPMEIPDCYLISDIELSDTLIGKRYNEGVFEDVPEPISDEDKFTSDYALQLGRV